MMGGDRVAQNRLDLLQPHAARIEMLLLQHVDRDLRQLIASRRLAPTLDKRLANFNR
jgi:hypothetical protein